MGVLDAKTSCMSYSKVEAQQVVRMEPRLRGVAYGADPTPWEQPAAAEVPIDERLARKDATKR